HADPPEAVVIRGGGDSSQGLAEAMRLEALEYFETIVFERQGSFADLMLSEEAFPRSEELARIFGTPVVDGETPEIGVNHPGLLHRPALLLSSGKRTSPIVRGAHVRKQFLCTDLTLPGNLDGVSEAQEALVNGDDVPNRELAEQATAAPACVGCHGLI